MRTPLGPFCRLQLRLTRELCCPSAHAGTGSSGELGINSTSAYVAFPTASKKIMTSQTFQQIAVGQNNVCGLLADNTVACWGECRLWDCCKSGVKTQSVELVGWGGHWWLSGGGGHQGANAACGTGNRLKLSPPDSVC